MSLRVSVGAWRHEEEGVEMVRLLVVQGEDPGRRRHQHGLGTAPGQAENGTCLTRQFKCAEKSK